MNAALPRIRPVRVEDMPAITAIYAAQVDGGVATYEYDPPDVDEMRRRMQALLDQGYPYLVAECDGRLAGYTYAGSYRARSAYRFTVENTVYVDAAFHGRRIGSALLQALIEACTARGFRQMIAVIGDSANAASVRLHQRAGFRTVGVFQGIGRKHGRWLDLLQMQRALGEGTAGAPFDE
ncbi:MULTISPECIES: GNAT family N-acetyltransferase [Pseudoxanthomonas]|uniref:L-amino acid N-acyltransferase YncA n=1 Tax=Pseudoxanthomonas winnipegensis TaxID=2480810 RepID=A0AAW8GC89_9GAMM|nr:MULTISPECIES: GNAT family N-acetyltransferase [Pseudoxanthomonas]MDQ1119198.1 L-amino acid N-acyltransferase YncA [Pseudoxanthomonas winnipegensis]MDQ1132390.1 L-amino acid N-acyltransferase YncA [Pseudoxanthomonas winnipegensis]MDR6137600.1 L-amino acid N-acyltransferase YncA [Pseudoxanthomonas sp. SORGH_AS_0997]